jgi:hypothetical protein
LPAGLLVEGGDFEGGIAIVVGRWTQVTVGAA